jgi:hypothetical protein
MKDNHYIDEIVIKNLNDLRIVPNKSWNDLNQKLGLVGNVKRNIIFDKFSKNSILKLFIGSVVVLSLITGSLFFFKDFYSNQGLSPKMLLKDNGIKSSNTTLYDSLDKELIEVQDFDNTEVKIKVKVPVHKNIIIRKKIILMDSINN